MNESDFFAIVAKHNLERFHSECITWAFNTLRSMNIKLDYSEISNDLSGWNFIQAASEVQQHDIILLFQNDNEQYKLVFIENKSKSGFSRKSISQFEKLLNKEDKESLDKDAKDIFKFLLEKFELDCKSNFNKIYLKYNGFLQTYYYKYRYIKKSKQITDDFVKIFKLENVNSNNFDDPTWIILSQMQEEIFKSLYANDFNNNIIEKKYGGWKYVEYKNLFDSVYNQFELLPSSNDLDLNFELVKSYFRYLSVTNFDNYEQLIDLIGLKEKLPKNKYNGKIEVYIDSNGSSNNPEPIFGVVFTDLENDKFQEQLSECLQKPVSVSDSDSKVTFSIGIQIQGESIKLYVACDDYNNKTLKDRENYIKIIDNYLFGKSLNKVKLKINELTFSPNGPKNKTFYSYSITSSSKEQDHLEIIDLVYENIIDKRD